ncbi:ATP-grasp domain-containing protein [Yinghuangia aomiensis]
MSAQNPAVTARVALVTCAELPHLDEDESVPIAPLAARGIAAEPAVWNDRSVDWDVYDLAIIRSTWDYIDHHAEFVAWAETVPRLANPADVVRWNSDKTYLRDLAAAGVPVVPTIWIEPDSTLTLPNEGRYVVKPAISAGSRNTGLYDMADASQRALAAGLATQLLAEGRTGDGAAVPRGCGHSGRNCGAVRRRPLQPRHPQGCAPGRPGRRGRPVQGRGHPPAHRLRQRTPRCPAGVGRCPRRRRAPLVRPRGPDPGPGRPPGAAGTGTDGAVAVPALRRGRGGAVRGCCGGVSEAVGAGRPTWIFRGFGGCGR